MLVWSVVHLYTVFSEHTSHTSDLYTPLLPADDLPSTNYVKTTLISRKLVLDVAARASTSPELLAHPDSPDANFLAEVREVFSDLAALGSVSFKIPLSLKFYYINTLNDVSNTNHTSILYPYKQLADATGLLQAVLAFPALTPVHLRPILRPRGAVATQRGALAEKISPKFTGTLGSRREILQERQATFCGLWSSCEENEANYRRICKIVKEALEFVKKVEDIKKETEYMLTTRLWGYSSLRRRLEEIDASGAAERSTGAHFVLEFVQHLIAKIDEMETK